jgi:hypothetical protein
MPEVTSTSPLDVGVGGDEAQFQHAGLAAAIGHAAHAAAQHLHRNRLVLVGQQRDFGLVNGKSRVTWPTTPVSSITGRPSATPCWEPRSSTILRVKGSRVSYRISPASTSPAGARGFQQLAQLGVFRRQELGLLQHLRAASAGSSARAFSFSSEDSVLRNSRRLPVDGVARRQRRHLQRIQHGAGHLAHGEVRCASTTSSTIAISAKTDHLDPGGAPCLKSGGGLYSMTSNNPAVGAPTDMSAQHTRHRGR